MRVSHGIWARGTLCLWGEDPALPAAPPGRLPSPAPHPFACQAAELADTLAALPGLKLTARSQTPSAASVTGPKFGLGDLVDFRYDVAVGDQALDPAELAELARLKVPLVWLRGQWVELDEAHLKAALKFLEHHPAGTMTAADALLAGLGAAGPGPGGEVPLADVDADGWLGDLLSGQADRRLAPMAAPAGFNGALRAYQERGLSWLSFLGGLGLGGILADDMGLGKTIQLLALIAAQPSGPTLLVCPMSLVGNWQREADRFTPGLRVHVHHGADRPDAEGFAAAAAAADLVITSYGVATRDHAALSGVTWARVVCDEAQTPDTRTKFWTIRRPASGLLDPSLPCVSIPGQGCLACS